MSARKVLVTGAAGRIGLALRKGLPDQSWNVRLADLQPLADLGPEEEFVQADITDMEAVEKLVDGVDAIVHLAASVSSNGWETMFRPNFIGAYNIFEAARRAGVKRVVYASSIHAHGFHRRDHKIGSETPPRPDSIYGVSKVFGEAVGRLYADKHGMEVVCLRIASFQPKPVNERQLSTWLSPRDCVHLVRRALDAPNVHFEALYGASANTRQIYDISNWGNIGYQPQDNAEDFAAEVAASGVAPEPEMERMFHGAMYVPREFSGDLDKIS
ncbi:NAD(P)-dependent oxidoreductase [Salmonella enterica subsp. enterica]|nr:NAD(P)-dependent oxidoreductase [Escherichia coli]MIL09188.1 NAD(P)-dependent oxidoreductase [Salmonella enterica subsp. enterica serovar Enteritidis]